ncbi:MAG: hypothetical protein ACRCVX_12700 [Shewanella sp.]
MPTKFFYFFGQPAFAADPEEPLADSPTPDDDELAKLRAQLEQERQGRIRETKLAKDRAEKLRQFEDIDPEEYRTMKEQAAAAKLKEEEAKGNYEAINRATAEKFAKTEAEYKSRIAQQEAELNASFANVNLSRAFAEADGQSRFAPYFEKIAADYYRVEVVDGQRQFVFQDRDGSPLLNKDRQEVKTAADLALYLKAESDAAVFFEPVTPVKGLGLQPNNAGGRGNSKVISVDRRDAEAVGRYSAELADGRARLV